MKVLKKVGILGILLSLLSCSNQAYDSITGYAVDYSEDKVLIVEAKDRLATNQNDFRDAVWITKLKEDRIGGLYTVQLGDGYDTYPGVSSAKKITAEQQLEGEKDIIRVCLDYANDKWKEGIAVIDSINYNTSLEEWEIAIGNISNDNTIILAIGKNEVITEK